ncbi:MAG TPA: hypothetical protein VN969_28045 [Streptosporangiaceae bacterium]|nr:hypothetical protein [Streptosporangiaceae bacterium]
MTAHLRAQTAAGTRRTARRRLGSPTSAAIAGRLATVAMWCLVACGPLALLATAAQHATSGPEPSAGTSASAASGIGPGGFAQLYVAAHAAGASSPEGNRCLAHDVVAARSGVVRKGLLPGAVARVLSARPAPMASWSTDGHRILP